MPTHTHKPSDDIVEKFTRAMREMPETLTPMDIIAFMDAMLRAYEIEGQRRVECLMSLLSATEGATVVTPDDLRDFEGQIH